MHQQKSNSRDNRNSKSPRRDRYEDGAPKARRMEPISNSRAQFRQDLRRVVWG